MRKKRDIRKKVNKHINLISIVIFLVLFLGINLIRVSQSNQFPTQESTIFLNDFNNYNAFNNEKGTNLFYEFIIEFSFIFGQELTIFIMLFVFGIINLFLFSKITNILLNRPIDMIIANTLFVLSNIFIVSITTFNYLPLIILLILWTILLAIRKPTLSFIPVIVSIFVNFEIAIANLILSIVLFIINKNIGKIDEVKTLKSKKFVKINIVIPIIIFAITYLFNIIKLAPLLHEINYSWWVTGISTLYTIPLICLALAIFALFTEIKNGKITILFILIIALSWLNFYIGIVSMFVTIILAAIGTRYIVLRKWFVKNLKKPAILLLILLFVFNSISFGQSIIEAGPTNEIVNDIKVLENYSNNHTIDTILCSFKDCEEIALYSNLTVYYYSQKYINEIQHYNKINETETILNNGNLDFMKNFFNKNNITTVYISRETLFNKWNRADEGMLLLLTQSERFVRLNNTEESFVYQYTNKSKE